ncbi:MAG: cytochrome B6 [Geobacteraceae bacterium]|nr:cytochrome B6 [Geobacteraceae bacterium]NTW78880.1 cytochrome B6 [Geobacteraceae bacterium]
MKTYLKSSPHFFRLIKRSLLLCMAFLLLLAALIPAPLQEPAKLSVVPNPVKSAWFLLWIQELVSYRVWLIYPVMLGGILFVAMPWLIGRAPERAVWFGPRHRTIAVLVLVLSMGILLLTLIGLFFRGENWALVMPF